MEENKNKSVVTSYRLKEDTRDKLKDQLKDLGLTQEEYFNKVVSMMELENVKQNNIFAVNATELQDLTGRIYNLFIGLCDQGNSFLSNKDTELEELKVKYKDMLSDKENYITQQKQELQEVYDKISILQNENDNNKSELINVKLDYDKQLEQLEQSLQDKASLIEEYKAKNDTMSSIVNEYKQYKEEVETLKQLLTDSQSKNVELTNTISTNDNTINQLNNSIDELNNKHSEKIEQEKEKAEFEKDKAILELKAEYQQSIQELNTERMQEISEYQAKYKRLLEEMEQLRQEKANKKEKTSKKVVKKTE